MRFLPILVMTSAAMLAPGAAAAQDPVDSDPPAHVSFVEGAALIERDGQTDSSPLNMPLLAGDRIRTQAGRVEILYADGSTLHIDQFTTVDFQSDELVRVLDGRVRLNIPGRPRDLGYRIDGPNAWAQISQPGEFRFAIIHGDRGVEVEFAVLRGAAELLNDDGRTPLRAGERAFARAGEAPSYAYVFNSAAWDAFDRWSESRRDYRLGLSSQYLPEPVRPYSRAFDEYGYWRHEPAYGYVWYPRVAVGWRPYYYGRWSTLRPWGWVWVGSDPWAWPTHHFGRWGFSAGAWFWIPGRVWGPAWVSWAYSPAYVSWCPLGWNNRPVFQFVSINVYSRGYDPWRAWTIVRRDHFGRDFVHRRVVTWDRIDVHARSGWEVRDRAPEFRGYAVPRAQAPIRVVGRAVPRGTGGSAPVYTNLPRDGSRAQSAGPRIQVDDTRAPGRRAVPRENAAEAPRMTPNRGVRSIPSVRSDGATVAPERSRAVPRSPGGRDDSSSTGSAGGAPENRATPRAVPRQPGRVGDTGQEPGRGGRVVPRTTPSESGAGRPVRSPYERRAPGASAGGGGDDGWRGSRQPAERAPESSPGGVRAMPRSAPEARPQPSAPYERRAPGAWSSERAVPRTAPESRPEPSMPPPYERRPPGGWSSERAVPRTAPESRPEPSTPPPYERRTPGGWSGGERAVPRRAPDAGPPASMPRIERSAPSAPSADAPRGRDRSGPPARTAPSGGDGGGGGERRAVRRRDG